MSTSEGVPHLYLDTNVIVDAIDNRWPPSRSLMEKIPTVGWECSTSRYTILEIMNIRQEEKFIDNRLAEGLTLSQAYGKLRGARRWGRLALKRRELLSIYDQVTEALQRYPFIKFQQPLAALWDDAVEYLAATNTEVPDSIHLATAVGIDCHVLVTRDQDLQKIANEFIPTVPPEHVEKALREKWGFDV